MTQRYRTYVRYYNTDLSNIYSMSNRIRCVDCSEHAVGAEHAVEDVADDGLFAQVVRHHLLPRRVRRRRPTAAWRRRSRSPIIRMRPQPVAEHPVADRLGAVRTPDVEVRPRIVSMKTPMLVPLRLADPQDEAHHFECAARTRPRRSSRRRSGRCRSPAWRRAPGRWSSRRARVRAPCRRGRHGSVRPDPRTPPARRVASTTSIGAAGGGPPTHVSSSGSASSCRVISSYDATTVHLPVQRSRSYGVLTAAGAARPPVVAEPLDERRRQPFRQDRRAPLADRQHRRIDRRSGAERAAADRRAEFELPPRCPPRRPQRDGRCRWRACGRPRTGRSGRLGPVRAPGRSSSSPSSSVVIPNGGFATTRYGSFGSREPADVGLDHPDPIALRRRVRSRVAQSSCPHGIRFDRPDRAPVAASGRVNAPVPAPSSTTRSSGASSSAVTNRSISGRSTRKF